MWRARLRAAVAAHLEGSSSKGGRSSAPPNNPLFPLAAAFSGAHYPAALPTARADALAALAVVHEPPLPAVDEGLTVQCLEWLDKHRALFG